MKILNIHSLSSLLLWAALLDLTGKQCLCSRNENELLQIKALDPGSQAVFPLQAQASEGSAVVSKMPDISQSHEIKNPHSNIKIEREAKINKADLRMTRFPKMYNGVSGQIVEATSNSQLPQSIEPAANEFHQKSNFTLTKGKSSNLIEKKIKTDDKLSMLKLNNALLGKLNVVDDLSRLKLINDLKNNLQTMKENYIDKPINLKPRLYPFNEEFYHQYEMDSMKFNELGDSKSDKNINFDDKFVTKVNNTFKMINSKIKIGNDGLEFIANDLSYVVISRDRNLELSDFNARCLDLPKTALGKTIKVVNFFGSFVDENRLFFCFNRTADPNEAFDVTRKYINALSEIFIGRGSYGIVFRVGDFVLKITTSPDGAKKEFEKANRCFGSFSPSFVAKPLKHGTICEFPSVVATLQNITFKWSGTGSVPINEFGYLVSEYKGVTLGHALSDILRTSSQDSKLYGKVKLLLADILAGLNEIHSHDYVHNDIKNNNICVAEDATNPKIPPKATIIDCGLMRRNEKNNHTGYFAHPKIIEMYICKACDQRIAEAKKDNDKKAAKRVLCTYHNTMKFKLNDLYAVSLVFFEALSHMSIEKFNSMSMSRNTRTLGFKNMLKDIREHEGQTIILTLQKFKEKDVLLAKVLLRLFLCVDNNDTKLLTSIGDIVMELRKSAEQDLDD